MTDTWALMPTLTDVGGPVRATVTPYVTTPPVEELVGWTAIELTVASASVLSAVTVTTAAWPTWIELMSVSVKVAVAWRVASWISIA